MHICCSGEEWQEKSTGCWVCQTDWPLWACRRQCIWFWGLIWAGSACFRTLLGNPCCRTPGKIRWSRPGPRWYPSCLWCPWKKKKYTTEHRWIKSTEYVHRGVKRKTACHSKTVFRTDWNNYAPRNVAGSGKNACMIWVEHLSICKTFRKTAHFVVQTISQDYVGRSHFDWQLPREHF